MSYSLNSLKEVISGIIKGTTIRVIKADTRSLDYSSYIARQDPSPETRASLESDSWTLTLMGLLGFRWDAAPTR